MSTSLQCPLCGEPEFALHILSGCKYSTKPNMVTDRHNIASRILLKAFSKGPLGAGNTQRQPQPLHLLPRSVTLASSFQERGTYIFWRSNTAKTPGPRISSRPPSNSTATSDPIFQGPQLKPPSIPFC
eukprot:1154304-Pelagomonas_calceolata.AAC.1